MITRLIMATPQLQWLTFQDFQRLKWEKLHSLKWYARAIGELLLNPTEKSSDKANYILERSYPLIKECFSDVNSVLYELLDQCLYAEDSISVKEGIKQILETPQENLESTTPSFPFISGWFSTVKR
jgi:hypothetical protein